MKPNRFFAKTLLLIVVLAFLGSAQGWTAEGQSSAKHFDLLISARHLQRESNTIRVTQGDMVELAWRSDEAGRLHLHGYDIEFEVLPDEPTVIRFEANATGRFPVSSHGFGSDHGEGHEALLYIEVYPD